MLIANVKLLTASVNILSKIRNQSCKCEYALNATYRITVAVQIV